MTSGRTSVLGFADGQWVELTDDAPELAGTPGQLFQIDTITASQRRITLKVAPTPLAAVADGIDPDRHPKLRRWDQKVDATATGVAMTGGWLALEDGVEVQFSDATLPERRLLDDPGQDRDWASWSGRHSRSPTSLRSRSRRAGSAITSVGWHDRVRCRHEAMVGRRGLPSDLPAADRVLRPVGHGDPRRGHELGQRRRVPHHDLREGRAPGPVRRPARPAEPDQRHVPGRRRAARRAGRGRVAQPGPPRLRQGPHRRRPGRPDRRGLATGADPATAQCRSREDPRSPTRPEPKGRRDGRGGGRRRRSVGHGDHSRVAPSRDPQGQLYLARPRRGRRGARFGSTARRSADLASAPTGRRASPWRSPPASARRPAISRAGSSSAGRRRPSASGSPRSASSTRTRRPAAPATWLCRCPPGARSRSRPAR